MSFLANLLPAIGAMPAQQTMSGKPFSAAVTRPNSTGYDISQQRAITQPMKDPTGWFGLKGTGRDILGAIGDAFLVQGGADPIYRPTREREKMARAMHGWADNPMEAIQRVAAIDPVAARQMEQEMVAQQAAAEKAALEGTETQLDINTKRLGLAGNLVGAVNEATYEPIKERLMALDPDGTLGIRALVEGAKGPDDLKAIGQMAISAKDRADDDRTRWFNEERLKDFDAAEARQERNTNSQISSRDLRDGLAVRRANRPSGGGGGNRRSGGKSSGGGGATRVVGGRTFREVSPGKWKPE